MNNNFEYYIGDTYTRDFTILGYSAEISNVFFTIKKSDNDKRYVLQKTLDDGITLTDVVYDDNGNIVSRTYNILINANDTEDLKPDYEYSYDIEIVTPGATAEDEDIKKTIIKGIFKVNNATTRVYNES